MPNVSSSMSRGQSHEVCNQIENACKQQGVNPEEITSGLIHDNFFFVKTNEYLLAIKEQKPAPIIEPQYFKLREGLLSVSASNGIYKEQKWKNFFKSGIENYTGNEWSYVTSGCSAILATKIQASDLIKDGKYSQFIKDEEKNFFQGIEQAFKAVEDNPALVEEVLKQDHRIHVTFTNASGARFVAFVCKCYGKLNVSVSRLSYDDVWGAEYGSVVLFPQQPLKN